MSVFLSLLGVAMMVTGLAAIYSGSLFVGIERGWTMVVAGSIGFSAGAVLLGLSAALRRLRRVERAIKMLAGAPTRRPTLETIVDAEPAAAAPASAAEAAGLHAETGSAAQAQPSSAERAEAAAAPGPEVRAPEPGPGPEPSSDKDPPPDRIIGTYQAGGNSYVMYADGSIRADTPSGEHRFRSMDEFKAFMLTGTLRGRAPEEPQKIAPPAGPDQGSEKPTAFSANA
jgi:hypothetical protein